ncbi:MAG: hypothetical protein ACK40N_13895 [Meiothermus ruber]|uniref:hypothetical protein n=1 Tax=Meiothermus TaxID=65551 RepID=UPI0021DEE20A|nr:hypothetical protein [Meiothermus sp.]GIW25755.1 MAG: hypothetical protein KatS3mg069_2022 [Meiothermus sp.]
MGNPKSVISKPPTLNHPTTQTYLEAVERASRCQAALQDALLASDASTLEARLAAFAQARAELRAARSTLLAHVASWTRAMFRPWKGVRYG